MTRVADTTTFSLQDVVNVVVPTVDGLQGCVNDSVNAYFNKDYVGDKDTLKSFRDYGARPITHSTLLSLTAQLDNPISESVTIAASTKSLILCIKLPRNATRSGGSPTCGLDSFTEVGSYYGTEHTEIWYINNPDTGSVTIEIPNSTTKNIQFTLSTLDENITLTASNFVTGTSDSISNTANVVQNRYNILIDSVVFLEESPIVNLNEDTNSDNKIFFGVGGGAFGSASQYKTYLNTTNTTDTLSWTIVNSKSYQSLLASFEII